MSCFFCYGIFHNALKDFDKDWYYGSDSAETPEEMMNMLRSVNDKRTINVYLYHMNHFAIGRVVKGYFHNVTGELGAFIEIYPHGMGKVAIELIKENVAIHLSLSISGLRGYSKKYKRDALHYTYVRDIAIVREPGRQSSQILMYIDDVYITLITRDINNPRIFRLKHNLNNRTDIMQAGQDFIENLRKVDPTVDPDNYLEKISSWNKKSRSFDEVFEKTMNEANESYVNALRDPQLYKKDLMELGGMTETEANNVIDGACQVKDPNVMTIIRCEAARAGINSTKAHLALQEDFKKQEMQNATVQKDLNQKLDKLQTEISSRDKTIQTLTEQLKHKDVQQHTNQTSTIQPGETNKVWSDNPANSAPKQPYVIPESLKKLVNIAPLMSQVELPSSSYNRS